MFKVGLTGGIGSGKTTVASLFEMLGVPVYYSDVRAKELMTSDQVREKIVTAFGADSYHDDGTLSRTHLAREVFGNPGRLKVLNSIVHPVVAADFSTWSYQQNTPYVIEEAAILIECGAHRHADAVIVVQAPLQTRIERVILRDNMSQQEVEKRIAAQMDDAQRLKYADHVILADGQKLLLPQIIEIDSKLRKKVISLRAKINVK